jgi:hypothetical protein
MKTSPEIVKAGAKEVVKQLNSKGWNTKWEMEGPDSTGIEATYGEGGDILVQVKASVSPAYPSHLSVEEIQNIKSRAANLGKDAYLARVNFANSNLTDCSIKFEKL